jgi:hypothetical protein
MVDRGDGGARSQQGLSTYTRRRQPGGINGRTQIRMTGTSVTRPSVVVLGGGYGGINVAKALVDPRWLERIFLPYRHLLSAGRFVRDRAVLVDDRRVRLASGEVLQPDYLVLATGSTYPFPAKTEQQDVTRVRACYCAAHLSPATPHCSMPSRRHRAPTRTRASECMFSAPHKLGGQGVTAPSRPGQPAPAERVKFARMPRFAWKSHHGPVRKNLSFDSERAVAAVSG